MQQLGEQLFWVLVIVIAGVMGAGMYKLNHRGSKTRVQALTGKGASTKAASQKSSGKKKKKR